METRGRACSTIARRLCTITGFYRYAVEEELAGRICCKGWDAHGVTSFYLGPRQPRLVLGSWGDVVAAVQSGATRETQWCELKLDVPAGAAAANDELARDLASLTVDGGVLLIGVKNNASVPADVVGIDDATLASLTSRISQVTASRVRPPMHVALHEIRNPAATSPTVLVVEVPKSAAAPHMVDGSYWGRSATGKQRLSDEDVTRLMREREGRAVRFDGELVAMAAAIDPLAPDRHARGRLYVMAQPLAVPSIRMSNAIAGKRVLELVVEALPHGHQYQWAQLYDLRYDLPHPDGRAAASDEQSVWGPDREADLSYALFRDDGAIQYISGAAVQVWDGEGLCISLAGVCETVQQVAQLAAHLSRQYLAYSGLWRLGLYLTGLKDLQPSLAFHSSFGGRRAHARFATDTYLRTANLTVDAMAAQTSEAVQSVATDFARGLGLAEMAFPYTDPADMARRLGR
jgi:hypothetical protein